MNQKSESRSRFAEFLRNRLVLAGSGILLLLILSALTAPLLVKAHWLTNPWDRQTWTA